MSTPGGGQLSDKLRLAASKGQTARIKELLESGATFEPDKNSRTAVHYAALNGHATTIKACIQQGCEPDIQDVAGRSPMHLAVTDGHVEAVRALIEEGCPVDRQDQVNGNTALHEAAWNGYSKSVEVLVGYGRANVHAANRSGMRPLHMAVQNGHNESARVLLRNGTHPDTRNNHGETPLHIGATHGHVTCCRILISAKCDINAVNKDGNTPLHVAASLGKRKITKILVEAGCDVNIKNNKGQTAIDVARDHEYPEVIIIMTSTPKAQTSRSRRHHRNHPTEYQRGHGPGAFSATDGPRSGFGPPWQQQSGMSWQQQAWNQWSWQRQQEQQYQNLQGQRQTPLERAMDLERQTHQNVQLGRITGNPHQHSEYYRDAFGSVHERPISNCNCMPYVRRLENQLEATKEKFMYDIESTTQMMEDKMKYFDKKMAHQSSCLDQLCKERIATERTECLHRIDRRAQKEQAEFERRSTVRINALRRELKGWFEDRFRHFERKYGDDFGIDLGSDHGREDPDDFDEPGASLLRSKSEGRLPSSQNDTSYERQGDSTNQRPGGKLPDKITATRTLQEVRYAKTKPIESTNDPYVLQEESENTATEKSQDSDQGKPVKPPKPPKPPKPLPPPRTVSYPSNSQSTAVTSSTTGAIPKRTLVQKWGETVGNPHLLQVSSIPAPNQAPEQNPATEGEGRLEQSSSNSRGTNAALHVYESVGNPSQKGQGSSQTNLSRTYELQGNSKTDNSRPNGMHGNSGSNWATQSNGKLQGHNQSQPPHVNSRMQYTNSAAHARPTGAPYSGSTARFNPNAAPRSPAASYSVLRTPNDSQSPQMINVSPITVNTSLANSSAPAQESPSTLASSPDSGTPRGNGSVSGISRDRDRDSSDSVSTSTSSRSRRDPIDSSLAMALLEDDDSVQSFNRQPVQTFGSQNMSNSMYSPPQNRGRPLSSFEVRSSQNSQDGNLFTASGKPHSKSDVKIAPKSPAEQVVPNITDKPRQNGDPHCKSHAHSRQYSTDSSDTSFDPVTVTQHFFDTVSNQMERWYERRIQDVQKQAEQKVSSEQREMKTKLVELESKIEQLKGPTDDTDDPEEQISV